jgi:hypothetical protein
LGISEIALGLAVLLWRDDFGPIFYVVVTIWAFLAAPVLLRQGLQQRALVRSRTSQR